MTREEAIANLEMIRVAFVEPVTKEQRKLIDDTFNMAIEALESKAYIIQMSARGAGRSYFYERMKELNERN